MRETIISEKRLITRLTTYWKRLKKDNELPLVNKINSAAIAEMWENCFILEIESVSKNRQYLFKHFGSGIKEAYGKDMSGQHVVSNIRTIPGTKVLEKVGDCVVDKIPHIEKDSFVNDNSKVIKFRSCILPFCSKQGGEVTHILVGLSWRAF